MNEVPHTLKGFEGEFHPKLAKLFDNLVKKYGEAGLEQTAEELILNKNGERIHILKRPYLDSEEGGKVNIEDYIKELIEK